MNTRNIFKQALRVRNKLSSYKNLMKLRLLGINHGRNCTIHGHLSIKLSGNSELTIGDNFYYSSGRSINPLCSNREGCICVNDGARICIGNNVGMSSTILRAHKSIVIGNNVKIGGCVTILDSDAHSLNWEKRRNVDEDSACKRDAAVIIEDDVLVGMNTLILKGVTIGARSIIGAGSVVTKNIPADCIAAGNPCKVLKYYNC